VSGPLKAPDVVVPVTVSAERVPTEVIPGWAASTLKVIVWAVPAEVSPVPPNREKVCPLRSTDWPPPVFPSNSKSEAPSWHQHKT
jgi:hypothetical protein